MCVEKNGTVDFSPLQQKKKKKCEKQKLKYKEKNVEKVVLFCFLFELSFITFIGNTNNGEF